MFSTTYVNSKHIKVMNRLRCKQKRRIGWLKGINSSFFPKRIFYSRQPYVQPDRSDIRPHVNNQRGRSSHHVANTSSQLIILRLMSKEFSH